MWNAVCAKVTGIEKKNECNSFSVDLAGEVEQGQTKEHGSQVLASQEGQAMW